MLFQYYPTVQHGFVYELNKDFTFSAAHMIDNESAGKCRNLHGHNYTVNVTVAGNDLDENGFLVNFQQLKKLIHDEFDHTNLCDSLFFDELNQPSTENMAKAIWEIIDTYLDEGDRRTFCMQVIVRETPTSYVRYAPYMESGKY